MFRVIVIPEAGANFEEELQFVESKSSISSVLGVGPRGPTPIALGESISFPHHPSWGAVLQ